MLGIGSKLKQIREIKKISQQEVAYHLNISQKTYSNIEANKTALSLSKLFKLSAFLEFDISELLEAQLKAFNGHNARDGNEDENSFPQKLLEQYECRLKENEELISLLREKIAFLQKRIDNN